MSPHEHLGLVSPQWFTLLYKEEFFLFSLSFFWVLFQESKSQIPSLHVNVKEGLKINLGLP